MAFQFRLRALLRLRQAIHTQRELSLSQATGEVSRLNGQIAECLSQILMLSFEDRQRMREGVRSSEVQFNDARRVALREKQRLLQRELRIAEENRAICLDAYQEAHQACEALEVVRRNHLDAYLLDVARREQRQLDDLFLMHRALKNSPDSPGRL